MGLFSLLADWLHLHISRPPGRENEGKSTISSTANDYGERTLFISSILSLAIINKLWDILRERFLAGELDERSRFSVLFQRKSDDPEQIENRVEKGNEMELRLFTGEEPRIFYYQRYVCIQLGPSTESSDEAQNSFDKVNEFYSNEKFVSFSV